MGLGKEGGCKGAGNGFVQGCRNSPLHCSLIVCPSRAGAGQQCLWGEKGKGRGL